MPFPGSYKAPGCSMQRLQIIINDFALTFLQELLILRNKLQLIPRTLDNANYHGRDYKGWICPVDVKP